MSTPPLPPTVRKTAREIDLEDRLAHAHVVNRALAAVLAGIALGLATAWILWG